MSTWDRSYPLSIDVDKPGGGKCLLDGKTSGDLVTDIEWMQGDVFPLAVRFRRKSTLGSNSTMIQMPSGAGMVLDGKASLSGESILRVSEWVSEGSGDELLYKGTLDLTSAALTTAIGTAASITVYVDVEIQAPGTAEPVTFRFEAKIHKQVYTGVSAPAPVGGSGGRWEEYTNANGAKCLRIKNSDGQTLVSFAPAGEAS
jgi:hypothetical protein